MSENPPEIPTAPMYKPGETPGLVYVTTEAVKKHDAIGDEPRDELFGNVEDYALVSCPRCDKVFTDWSTRFGYQDLWMDYDHHISTRHRGEKWAVVTLHGEVDYGFEEREAGKHFRRNVKTESVDLLSFEVTSDGYRPSYTAKTECGHWRGDIPNSRLSESLNRVIDFAEFEDVDVEWHHRAPRRSVHPEENVEAAREAKS
jgi:hypothetical protein